jgi:ketosteroid isomerase-like protein
MSRENVEIVGRLYTAFNERDVASVIEVCAPRVELRPAFIGGGIVEGAVYQGHAGIREFIAMQDETWASVKANPVTIRDLGDAALVEVHLQAVGRASGIPVDRTTWNVIEIGDGKVARLVVYTTKEEALDAAGRQESRSSFARPKPKREGADARAGGTAATRRSN